MTIRKVAATDVAAYLDEVTGARLEVFRELLVRWNQRMNLVARGDEKRLVPRHLHDALTLVPLLRPGRILDIGTGAGLPGIPLAMVRPNDDFVLLDRSARRTAFVRHVVMTLELGNVEVVTADIHEYQPQSMFDTVVTRAVAPPRRILPIAWRFVAPGGRVLLQVGEEESGRRFTLSTGGVAPAGYERVAVEPDAGRRRFVWVVDAPAAGN